MTEQDLKRKQEGFFCHFFHWATGSSSVHLFSSFSSSSPLTPSWLSFRPPPCFQGYRADYRCRLVWRFEFQFLIFLLRLYFSASKLHGLMDMMHRMCGVCDAFNTHLEPMFFLQIIIFSSNSSSLLKGFCITAVLLLCFVIFIRPSQRGKKKFLDFDKCLENLNLPLLLETQRKT